MERRPLHASNVRAKARRLINSDFITLVPITTLRRLKKHTTARSVRIGKSSKLGKTQMGSRFTLNVPVNQKG